MGLRSRSLASIVLVVLALQASAIGGTLGEKKYSIDLDGSMLQVSEKSGYTCITLPECGFDADPGYPMVPFITRNYILPAGSRAVDVHLEVLSTTSTNVALPVYPAQPMRPLSASQIDFVEPISKVYSSVEPVDDFYAEVLYDGYLQGEMIVTIGIHPVRYTPESGQLDMAESMVLRISYDWGGDHYTVTRSITSSQLKNLRVKIQQLVENPEDLQSRNTRNTRNTLTIPAETGYRHAIVTTADFASGFKALADWNTARGVRDTVVTIEQISALYPGDDLAEKIRNFVEYAHSNWGLEYLLLGGDAEFVPTRICYTAYAGGGDLDLIPTDMYFGCLDGDWDYDGDGVFGEMADDVDLYAEVSVGRACVDEVEDVTLFVQKTLTYEQNPASGYLDKLLLPSEILWESPYYPGDATNNTIADLAPSGTYAAKLYETEGTLSKFGFRDSMNIGYGLAHHMAHGNYQVFSCADAGFREWEARLLTNQNKLTVFVSIACLVGGFDYEQECLVEGFQESPDGGTVAWVGNSRYGWGSPPGRGPSEDLDISFFEEVYGKGSSEIGPDLVVAKEENIGRWAGSSFGRWAIYELNLHGDPAMPVHYRDPSQFVVSCPEEIWAGQQILTVNVSSQDGYATGGVLVCLRLEPSIYVWDYTNSSGDAVFDIELPSGKLDIEVTGANHFPATKTVNVGTAIAGIELADDTVFIDAEIDPLNGSFEILSTGSDTLRVSSINPVTSWISSVAPDSFMLLPQQTLSVGFTIDTTDLEDGFYVGEMTVHSNDPANPQISQFLKLTKGDWPDISSEPVNLVFNIPEGDQLISSVTINNLGRADLIVSDVTGDRKWISEIEPREFDVPQGAPGVDVLVTVDTTGLGYGSFDGRLIISSNDPDELKFQVPVVLDMGTPDIALSPDTLEFFYSWETGSSNTVQQTLSISNEGTRNLTVSQINSSKSWLNVVSGSPLEVGPSSNQDVVVVVSPENLKHGDHYAQLTVISDDPDEPSVIEPVKFTVVESSPGIQCSPDTAVVDRQSLQGFFWVCNTGMLDLTVSSVNTETPWIWRLYPKEFVVSGNDSVQVAILGDSTKYDGKIGLITMETNDPDNPTAEEYVKMGSASGIAGEIPLKFDLSAVYPNPFWNRCAIMYAVPYAAPVNLEIYDISGKKVRSFSNGNTPPGYYTVVWNGEDDWGRILPQGVYVLRMCSPELNVTRKLVLLR